MEFVKRRGRRRPSQLCIISFPDNPTLRSFFELMLQLQYFPSSLSSVDAPLDRPPSAPRTYAHTDSPVRWCLIYGLICVAQLGLGNAD